MDDKVDPSIQDNDVATLAERRNDRRYSGKGLRVQDT